MAQVTSRIAQNTDGMNDRYNSHWSPTWRHESGTYGESGSFGNSEEFELFSEWYGGIYDISWRFQNITIPQGATITSAKITVIRNSGGGSDHWLYRKLRGVAQDDNSTFSTSDTAQTRSHTTAAVDWDFLVPASGTFGDVFDSADITSIIQEIIDRGGWASGNSIAIYNQDDGTPNGNFLDYKYYSSYPNDAALLTITYELGGSPSVSPSASVSPSKSPSSSASPSTSVSPSPSSSASASPSPSPLPPPNPAVLKIAKQGVNVLTNSDIEKLIFSSEYGTLKYFTKQAIATSFDASTGDITCKGEYTHDLGYYPYVEVYVSVYIGSPTGVYEYCPFVGSGASVAYLANVKIDTSKITVYGEISGVSSEVWHFDFLVFVFKNKVDLT